MAHSLVVGSRDVKAWRGWVLVVHYGFLAEGITPPLTAAPTLL